MNQQQERVIEELIIEVARIVGARDVAIIINNQENVASIVSCHSDKSMPLPEARLALAKMLRGVASGIENGDGEPTGRDGQVVKVE